MDAGVLTRTGLVLAGLAGALLLVAATFTTVIAIRVGTVERVPGLETDLAGWDRHGPAMLLLGLVAFLMVGGAARGARPAMLAVAALGAAALAIAIASDLPATDDTGRVGALYAEATAQAGFGFYAETLGGVLLLLCGGGLLILSGGRERRGVAPMRGSPRRSGGR